MKAFATLLFVCVPALLADYSHCQPIVIHHALVPNSDQSGYVLTIADTDPGIADAAHGGYVQSPSGYDIVFSSDALGRNLLTWDPPEVYNSATGQLVVHVQVGTVSHTSDTTLYRCAGNNRTSLFQGGGTGAAWPAMYQAVYHGGDGTVLAVTDSTVHGNSGTSHAATEAVGQIGGAVGLSGSSQYIGVPNNASLQMASQFSIELWAKNTGGSGYQELLRKGGHYYLFRDTSGFLGLAIEDDYSAATAGSIVFPASSWTHVVATYDSGTGAVKIYKNGTLVNSRVTANSLVVGSEPLALGAIEDGSGQFFTGTLDEIRIANTVLSADRVSTDYNNQSSPSAFYSPGAWAALAAAASSPSQTLIF